MPVGLDPEPLFWGEGVELRLEEFAPGKDLGVGEAVREEPGLHYDGFKRVQTSTATQSCGKLMVSFEDFPKFSLMAWAGTCN